MTVPDPIPTPELLERLCQPISPDRPCGDPIRYDPQFLDIRLEREEDDPNLPMGVWERPLKRANWARIAEQCEQLLEQRSKDLQLVAWLTEAWMRTGQLAGLSCGLELLQGLVSRHWDDLHPLVEDGDLDARLSAFEWMNEALPLVLRLHIVLAELPDRRPSAVTVADWDRMTATELSARERDEAPGESDDGATGTAPVTRNMVIAYSHGHGQARARHLAAETERSLRALDGLDAMLRERVGDGQSPSLAQLQKALAHLQRVVHQLMASEPELKQEADDMTPILDDDNVQFESPAPLQDTPAAAPPNLYRGNKAWSSREEAYQTLEELADYLGRIEPHSPTPYLIRRAVNWGRMPLPELMAEIVREEGDLNRLISLLGLQRE
jgi:type VI secretion system protein ImpA